MKPPLTGDSLRLILLIKKGAEFIWQKYRMDVDSNSRRIDVTFIGTV